MKSLRKFLSAFVLSSCVACAPVSATFFNTLSNALDIIKGSALVLCSGCSFTKNKEITDLIKGAVCRYGNYNAYNMVTSVDINNCVNGGSLVTGLYGGAKAALGAASVIETNNKISKQNDTINKQRAVIGAQQKRIGSYAQINEHLVQIRDDITNCLGGTPNTFYNKK